MVEMTKAKAGPNPKEIFTHEKELTMQMVFRSL